MSTDMFGPLSDMPVGTTVDAHVASPCLSAGERLTKRQFLLQVLETPEPSWHGCGHPAPVT